MVRAQAHRGPDDEGLVTLPVVGTGRVGVFGSRRLAILDLSSAGHQPMSNENGTVWVVHNGEIYNFQELRAQLAARGYRFRSNTDTEVIIRAYEAYGEQCVNVFRGMFAFAVWDANTQRLLLARDRLGEKPLYFSWDGTRLLFASELRAVLASGLVAPQLNHAAISGYLTFGSVPGPFTIIDGVKMLEPGCLLSWHEGRLQIKRYWDLAFEEDASLTERDTAEGLYERFRDAVKEQLISDVPLGAFLSGGLDSSSVVALMRDVGVSQLRTFSLTFDDPQFNEGPYARLVARRYETEHTEQTMTAAEVLGAFDAVISAMDQPTVDGFNTYFVSKLTRSSGTIVALSGLGGDELFGGYSTFWWVPRLCRLAGVLRRLPGSRPLLASALGWSRDGRTQKFRALLRHAPSVEAAYLTTKGLLLDGAREQVLAGGGDGFDALAYLQHIGDGRTMAPQNRVSHLELRTYMQHQLLRDADAMSMAHGLELRVPLLDHRLVEFVERIPARIKFRSTPKALLIQSMGHRLPPEVISRSKMGFGFPFEQWMKQEWRPTIEARLFDGVAQATSLWNPQGVTALWQDFLAGRVRWSRVWALVVLQAWIDRHVRGLTPMASAEVQLTAALLP